MMEAAMRRVFVFLAGVLVLLTAGQASALSMLVLSSEIFVDVFARAETTVRDRPLKSGENLELDTAVALFVRQGGSASATSNAISQRLPFLDRPERLETGVELDVEAKTKSSVEAEASSSGGGSVRVLIEGKSAADPAAALAFDITLDSANASGAQWSFSYLVFNETRGTTIFSVNVSNAGGTVPTSFIVPVGFGDTIRIDWMSEITVEAANGTTSTGSLDYGGSFGTTLDPVPEPASFALLLGGLLAFGGARHRRL
jgi:hypothetical protein